MKDRFTYLLCIIVAATSIVSCKKYLPSDRDALSSEARFLVEEYSPTLGQTTVFNTFNASGSTQPLTFKLLNPRTRNGEVAQELLDVFPVKVWKEAYTGLEKSLEEIERKRAIENHRIFEIREHSGQFVMWPIGNSNFIKCRPDSGYLFDVEVSNSGGRKYFRNLRLMPYRERDYEPNPADRVTGQSLGGYATPSRMVNVFGERKGSINPTFMFPGEVAVMFHRVGDGNSLKFRFLDSLQNPINPDKFADTDWKHLVHGFNMEKTDTYVKYQIGFPMPYTSLRTSYTDPSGARAQSSFKWSRRAISGLVLQAELQVSFALFKEGEWEAIIWFKGAYPKFTDD